MKSNKKILFLASFEDASILRKFTILFLITSIVPMTLLYYFYLQSTQHGNINISTRNYTNAMVLMAQKGIIKRVAREKAAGYYLLKQAE